MNVRPALYAVTAAAALHIAAALAQDDIVRAHEALDHAGDYAMVCGVIADARHARDSRGDPTYLNFDKPYPEQDFTAIVWGRDRKRFAPAPETHVGAKACVYGKVERYKGKAQMAISRPEQLSVAAKKPE
jgi:hypothetical protein